MRVAPRSAHAAAKKRLKDGAHHGEGAGAENHPPAAVVSAATSAQVEGLEATITQLKAKLNQAEAKIAHAEHEKDRDKHKLQRTVDAAQLKRFEWEREKQSLKRQVENHEAEVRKRDKWLDKAKDIIKEYQKRHAPGAPSTPHK